ncbi:MAG: MBL fold metallo-hydrolase, partial [Desulfobacterales bacterium]
MPSLKRSSCAVLLEIGETKLLFDSGAGTIHRLLKAGIEIFDIDVVFYSHFHPDHTGELVPFIFATKYPDSNKRNKLLTMVGGIGFINFINRLKSAYHNLLELPENQL